MGINWQRPQMHHPGPNSWPPNATSKCQQQGNGYVWKQQQFSIMANTQGTTTTAINPCVILTNRWMAGQRCAAFRAIVYLRFGTLNGFQLHVSQKLKKMVHVAKMHNTQILVLPIDTHHAHHNRQIKPAIDSTTICACMFWTAQIPTVLHTTEKNCNAAMRNMAQTIVQPHTLYHQYTVITEITRGIDRKHVQTTGTHGGPWLNVAQIGTLNTLQLHVSQLLKNGVHHALPCCTVQSNGGRLFNFPQRSAFLEPFKMGLNWQRPQMHHPGPNSWPPNATSKCQQQGIGYVWKQQQFSIMANTQGTTTTAINPCVILTNRWMAGQRCAAFRAIVYLRFGTLNGFQSHLSQKLKKMVHVAKMHNTQILVLPIDTHHAHHNRQIKPAINSTTICACMFWTAQIPTVLHTTEKNCNAAMRNMAQTIVQPHTLYHQYTVITEITQGIDRKHVQTTGTHGGPWLNVAQIGTLNTLQLHVSQLLKNGVHHALPCCTVQSNGGRLFNFPQRSAFLDPFKMGINWQRPQMHHPGPNSWPPNATSKCQQQGNGYVWKQQQFSIMANTQGTTTTAINPCVILTNRWMAGQRCAAFRAIVYLRFRTLNGFQLHVSQKLKKMVHVAKMHNTQILVLPIDTHHAHHNRQIKPAIDSTTICACMFWTAQIPTVLHTTEKNCNAAMRNMAQTIVQPHTLYHQYTPVITEITRGIDRKHVQTTGTHGGPWLNVAQIGTLNTLQLHVSQLLKNGVHHALPCCTVPSNGGRLFNFPQRSAFLEPFKMGINWQRPQMHHPGPNSWPPNATSKCQQQGNGYVWKQQQFSIMANTQGTTTTAINPCVILTNRWMAGQRCAAFRAIVYLRFGTLNGFQLHVSQKLKKMVHVAKMHNTQILVLPIDTHHAHHNRQIKPAIDSTTICACMFWTAQIPTVLHTTEKNCNAAMRNMAQKNLQPHTLYHQYTVITEITRGIDRKHVQTTGTHGGPWLNVAQIGTLNTLQLHVSQLLKNGVHHAQCKAMVVDFSTFRKEALSWSLSRWASTGSVHKCTTQDQTHGPQMRPPNVSSKEMGMFGSSNNSASWQTHKAQPQQQSTHASY